MRYTSLGRSPANRPQTMLPQECAISEIRGTR